MTDDLSLAARVRHYRQEQRLSRARVKEIGKRMDVLEFDLAQCIDINRKLRSEVSELREAVRHLANPDRPIAMERHHDSAKKVMAYAQADEPTKVDEHKVAEVACQREVAEQARPFQAEKGQARADFSNPTDEELDRLMENFDYAASRDLTMRETIRSLIGIWLHWRRTA